MALTENDVAKIARLARLRVVPEERAALAADLTRIVDWMAQLDEVNTDGVAPMAYPGAGGGLRLRDDVVTDGGARDAVLANAPETDGEFFLVPRVVE